MSLNDEVAAQFPAEMISIYGELVTYHVSTPSTNLSIYVIPLRDTRGRAFDISETVEAEVMDFTLRATDVALPADSYLAQLKDYLIFETLTWYVIRLDQRNVGGLHRIHCATKNFRFL